MINMYTALVYFSTLKITLLKQKFEKAKDPLTSASNLDPLLLPTEYVCIHKKHITLFFLHCFTKMVSYYIKLCCRSSLLIDYIA